jgi:cytochrome c oxidase subunit II
MRPSRFLLTGALLLGGCNRHQSALAPFGEEAGTIAEITVVMTVGAAVIAALVAGLMIAAWRAEPGRLGLKGGERLILGFGGVLPAVLLLALLAYSMPPMRPRPVAREDLRVTVEGEQFWWRVRYQPPGAPQAVSANEVRIPVGRTVAFNLRGGDVIHSFWVPGLAGKTDMIPGRENKMAVRAVRPGRYRGQCTEFCGLSHALMAFDVVAMEPAAFDRWLADLRRPAVVEAGPGGRLFSQYGCGGCHAIRGTGEAGGIGPDLTHYGQRATLAAGILTNTDANTARFIRHPEATKPGVRMPAFGHMPPADALAVARYLRGLR